MDNIGKYWRITKNEILEIYKKMKLCDKANDINNIINNTNMYEETEPTCTSSRKGWKAIHGPRGHEKQEQACSSSARNKRQSTLSEEAGPTCIYSRRKGCRAIETSRVHDRAEPSCAPAWKSWRRRIEQRNLEAWGRCAPARGKNGPCTGRVTIAQMGPKKWTTKVKVKKGQKVNWSFEVALEA